MKLNFGSAKDRLPEFLNVDAMDWNGNTHILHDMTQFPYPFEENSVEEIRTVENMEHISFRLTKQVLGEFHRILQPGGKLYIQVPDCGKAMEYYVNRKICDCVPHKAVDGEFKPREGCPVCGGKAIINPDRWLLSFTGAQKHPFDAHLNIFTRQRMTILLFETGFGGIEYFDDLYKIKVQCFKQENKKTV